MGADAILALAGLIAPPAIDFFRKKFLPDSADNPERTMSSLATTKPDVLPQYVEAMSGYLKAQTEHFNRDVIGAPSQKIVDIRAGIRPLAVVVGFVLLGLELTGLQLDPATRSAIILNNASWFGSRLV